MRGYRGKTIALIAAIATGTGAQATDKPAIGPAPAWVKAVVSPRTVKEDEQPVRMLLLDQQARLERGETSVYTQFILKVQTPQGLAAGNVSFPWRAETDSPTVHKLLIRRGDTVIDVLATQSFTVVRREPNLESAMLDNVLTATIQPEGLQVGDIVDFAMTIVSRDPTLKDHVEFSGMGWNVPMARAHTAIEWPAALPIKLRQSKALPALKPTRHGEMSGIELQQDDLVPLVMPKQAPGRFLVGRFVELSDYQDWNAVARLMLPLYDKAAVIGNASPLKAEIARIAAASADPTARAQAVLALVQDRVRYVALLSGTGGLVPADADVTWSRRFGDCKGKTALLIGLLRALGIAADPVLVNTRAGDMLADRQPAAGLFDHVLVHATIAGKAYWLDGTRTGDVRLDRIKTPFFHWGLPVAATTTALVPIIPPPLDQPTETVTIRIDAHEGITLPAPTHAEVVTTGDDALGMKLGLAQLTADARERGLRDYWKGKLDDFDPKTVTARYDAATATETLVADGTTAMDWKRGYRLDGVALGYAADFKRDAGPNADAPYANGYPFYSIARQTILLPPGWQNMVGSHPSNIDRTIAGVAYRRTSVLKDNVFTVEASSRSLTPEFPFADAAEAQPALRDLANQTVTLNVPRAYRMSDKETAVLLESKPTTPDEIVRRASLLADKGRQPEAQSEVARALAIDPANARGLALQALLHVTNGGATAAAKEIEAAVAANPGDPMLARMGGLVAFESGDYTKAVAIFSAALVGAPDDGDLHAARAQAYARLNDATRALSDCDAAIAAHTGNPEAYLLKANLLRRLGRRSEVESVAAAVSKDLPGNSYGHVVAANIYSSVDNGDAALREFSAALAIKPEAYVYLNRALRWPADKAAAALADFDAALKLDPKLLEAYQGKAEWQIGRGDAVGALATVSAGLAVTPDAPDLRVDRAIAQAMLGHGDIARAEIDAVRAKANPMTLNNNCYSLAQHDLVLDFALSLCDASLTALPDAPATLDSRGYVKLRLKRYEDAIADFDKALAKMPKMAPSLYGRAIAYARKGEMAKSKADADAALKSDPKIAETYARYGVTL